MALILALLSLLGLAFISGLTLDGLRAMLRRRRAEQAKKPLLLRLAKRREIAGELLCLELVEPNGKALPPFTAGQHLMLSLPAGRHGQTIQRAYSLAAWTKRPQCYELGIKLETPGAMTQWLWHHLSEGATLEATLPQGDFVVAPGTGSLVLIGGGIGITPMRAMLHAALASGRPVTLFHSARSAEQLLYRDEFSELAERHPRFAYRPTLSRPAAEWPGESGRLDAGRIVKTVSQAETADFYLCAGGAMMAALRQGLLERGVSERRIHSEAFGANAGAGQRGLSLAVSQSGTTKTVITTGEPTILATLEANDIAVPVECRAGSCGRCVSQLVSGEVDWLLEPEFAVSQNAFLPCICAAKSDLDISFAS